MTPVAKKLQDKCGPFITPHLAEVLNTLVRSQQWNDITELISILQGEITEPLTLGTSPKTHDEYLVSYGIVRGMSLFKTGAESISEVYREILTEENTNVRK